MLTVSDLARIASRHATRMADAMIAVCVRHALETGEKLDMPERAAIPRRRGRRPRERKPDYDRIMRTNSETEAMRRG